MGPGRVLPEGHEVLFDPDQDPALTMDLAARGGPRLERVRAAVLRWVAASSTGERVQADVSAEEEAQLQALGYGGADVPSGPEED